MHPGRRPLEPGSHSAPGSAIDIVGSLPDMVTISPDGEHAIVATEGEPADDFPTDPEGSVAVVDLPAEVAAPQGSDVRTADFHDFEDCGAKTLPEDVRIFGPTPESDLPILRNLEPEYITVARERAYATLQEANAIAVVDIATAEVTEILPLGFKDYGRAAVLTPPIVIPRMLRR